MFYKVLTHNIETIMKKVGRNVIVIFLFVFNVSPIFAQNSLTARLGLRDLPPQPSEESWHFVEDLKAPMWMTTTGTEDPSW